MHEQFDYSTDSDRPLFMVHAVTYLSRCEKDRSSALLKSIVKRKVAADEKLVIPDYALDMHTERGRNKGRDMLHFLHEGSKVVPEKKGEERGYLLRLIEMINTANHS